MRYSAAPVQFLRVALACVLPVAAWAQANTSARRSPVTGQRTSSGLAEAARQPSPEPVQISIEPPEIVLTSSSRTQAVVITGRLRDGSVVDLTAKARLAALDPKVADAGAGIVRASGNGSTQLRAAFGAHTATAKVEVRALEAPPRESGFAADIAPVFSRLGCNSSNCHGTLTGQNGFKLSLFGYDADADYDAVVKASEGRRVNKAEPGKSLLLQKPTFQVSHGGGMLFAKDTPEYRVLHDWIARGAPKGSDAGPRLKSLEVFPRGEIVLARRGEPVRLVVRGLFSDGSAVDLTSQVRYISNNEAVASVSDGGVLTPKTSGDAAVMVRSLGAVGVARVSVVLRAPIANYP